MAPRPGTHGLQGVDHGVEDLPQRTLLFVSGEEDGGDNGLGGEACELRHLAVQQHVKRHLQQRAGQHAGEK